MNRRTLIGGAIAAVVGLFTGRKALPEVSQQELEARSKTDWVVKSVGPTSLTYGGRTITIPLGHRAVCVRDQSGTMWTVIFQKV